jgi:hypothetical protein
MTDPVRPSLQASPSAGITAPQTKIARLRMPDESDPCHIVRVSHPLHRRIIDSKLRSFLNRCTQSSSRENIPAIALTAYVLRRELRHDPREMS